MFWVNCLQLTKRWEVGEHASVLRVPPCSPSRYGVQPCPICLADALEPVCLPCDHVYCKPCICLWLSTERRCPLCLTDLPDKFSIQVSPQHR